MKPCSHPVVLPRHPAIRFKDKSERSVLPFAFVRFVASSERSVPRLPLYALLQNFVARSALVPLQPVVTPETSVECRLPVVVPLQTDCHPACARFFSCSPLFGHACNLFIISWWDIHDRNNHTPQVDRRSTRMYVVASITLGTYTRISTWKMCP